MPLADYTTVITQGETVLGGGMGGPEGEAWGESLNLQTVSENKREKSIKK